MSESSEKPPRAGVAVLPSLTALRGLAALAVLASHSVRFAFPGHEASLLVVFKYGYPPVDLFFILSGFVLAHVYADRFASRDLRSAFDFLWARLCRIYPASIFTVAVLSAMYLRGHIEFPAAASFTTRLLASLSLTQALWPNDLLLNPPSWSISVEWCSYLFFPVIVPAVCRCGSRALKFLIALTLLLAVVEHVSAEQIGYSQIDGWGAFARSLSEFTLGVVTYLAFARGQLGSIWKSDFCGILVWAVLIAAAVFTTSNAPVVLCFVPLLLTSVSNRGRVAAILNSRLLTWLGDISYSVYIFQWVILLVIFAFSETSLGRSLGGIALVFLAIGLGVASGALVHRTVEVPMRDALRRAIRPAKFLPDRRGRAPARLSPERFEQAPPAATAAQPRRRGSDGAG